MLHVATRSCGPTAPLLSVVQQQRPSRLKVMRTSANEPCSYFEIPSYEQIFIPPHAAYKEAGKLYGKELLQQHFYSQYLPLMTNRRIIKGWLTDYDLFANPPNLRDAKVSTALKTFIDEKKSELATLNFRSTTYKMQTKEIYEVIKEMLHYARKKLKLKVECDHVNHEVSSFTNVNWNFILKNDSSSLF